MVMTPLTNLDGRLTSLQALARQWGEEFKEHGAELERDPEAVRRLQGLAGVSYLSTAGIPEAFGGTDLRIGPYSYSGRNVLERALIIEELACGDAGLMLSAPGPSMSGVLIEQLGDADQKTRFYGRLLREPTWTFFALTEREHGSDAMAIETAVVSHDDGSRSVSGAKCYVGNAARSALGTVFARTGPGPLSVASLLIDTARPGFRAEPLTTIGLRGAQICEIVMDAVPVEDGDVLGRHLPPTRRGTWASVRVFNRLRPGVAAIAVGISRALLESFSEAWSHPPATVTDEIDELRARVWAVQSLVRRAALTSESGAEGHLASMAKGRACVLAEDISLTVCRLLGPGARLQLPRLDKLVREARGVEFMEGTRNIQALNTFQGLLTGRLDTTRQLQPQQIR